MDLPPELWMNILENVHLNNDVRQSVSQTFAASMRAIDQQNTTTDYFEAVREVERAAVKALPAFELQAWKATRCFYSINRNSRTAALKLHLSSILMLQCRTPVVVLPKNSPCDCYVHSGTDCSNASIVDASLKDFATIEIYGAPDTQSILATPNVNADMVIEREIVRLADFTTCIFESSSCKFLGQVKKINLLATIPTVDATARRILLYGVLEMRNCLRSWREARNRGEDRVEHEFVVWQ